jgi:hypothetical protein
MASAWQLSKVLRTKMWFQTVDHRAEAAAVNAMASGSQHKTMRAIRHPRAYFLNAEAR